MFDWWFTGAELDKQLEDWLNKAELSYGPARGIIAVSRLKPIKKCFINFSWHTFSLTPATATQERLLHGHIVRYRLQLWKEFSFLDPRIMSDCESVHSRFARSTKRHFMISKLIHKSMLISMLRRNFSGWIWRPMRMSTASKCICRTSLRWWRILKINLR